MCAGDCKFSSPCMKMQENTVRLMDNIESKQYTATGAGIWLNSCIEITLYDKIVFSEISIGLCWHHNAIILSCLPPEMDPVWPTCRKAVTRCDVSVLGDCTWALTPPGELTQRPQYCILSLKCYAVCDKCLRFTSILQRRDSERSVMWRIIFTHYCRVHLSWQERTFCIWCVKIIFISLFFHAFHVVNWHFGFIRGGGGG